MGCGLWVVGCGLRGSYDQVGRIRAAIPECFEQGAKGFRDLSSRWFKGVTFKVAQSRGKTDLILQFP